MAEKEYILNGIRFASAIEYQNAKKEQEGIAYIREKNDMSDDNVVLALYNKFVQKKVFRTQIGHDFLKELQEKLMRSSVIDKSQVARLPIYEEGEGTSVASSSVKAAGEEVRKNVAQTTVSDAKKVSKTTNASHSAASVSKTGATTAKAKSNIRMEYAAKTKTSENDKKVEEYKRKYGWSLFINFVLVLILLAMAYITLNGNNVNILNYEEKLQDEYAAWAEKLLEKEKELNRLERELNEMLDN